MGAFRYLMGAAWVLMGDNPSAPGRQWGRPLAPDIRYITCSLGKTRVLWFTTVGSPNSMSLLFHQEEIDMNAGTVYAIRRRLTVLTIATLLALSTAYAPVLLDGTTGTAMTHSVSACNAQSSGGGGC